MTARRTNICVVCIPGLEHLLVRELRELGIIRVKTEHGGVSFKGRFEDVVRTNIALRGAIRVLVRIAEFGRDKPSLDRLPWEAYLKRSEAVRVGIIDRRRYGLRGTWPLTTSDVEETLTTLGYRLGDDGLKLWVRFEDERTVVSVDTSGESLDIHKPERARWKIAPMRAIVCGSMLHAFGYRGSEPLIVPVGDTGTLLLEALGIATGIPRRREREYDFERMAGFAPSMYPNSTARELSVREPPPVVAFYCGDARPERAIARIEEAGFGDIVRFVGLAPGELDPPEAPGLLIVPAAFPLGPDVVAALNDRYRGWRLGRAVPRRSSGKMAPGLDFEKVASSDHFGRVGRIDFFLARLS